jgi:transcriptional regulator with XRE-family HTH domain
MEMITIADWIEEELKKRHWSRAELAKRSGVSESQISRFMSGQRGIGEKSIRKIADALNYPPQKIFEMAGLLPKEKGKDSRVAEATHLFSLLPDEQKESVLIFMRALIREKE